MSLAACAADEPEPLARAQQHIYDGSDGQVFADQGARPAVVRLSLAGEKCGGVLIASDVVLTAAHCLDGIEAWPDDPPPPIPEGDYVVNLPGLGLAASDLPNETSIWRFPKQPSSSFWVDEVRRHPDFPGGGAATDVAFFRLSTGYPRHMVQPMSVATPSTVHGRIAAHVFGVYTHQADCSGLGTQVRYMLGEAYAWLGQSGPHSFPGLYGGPGSTMCKGDSGSPIVSHDWGGPANPLPDDQVFSVVSQGPGSSVLGANLQRADVHDWLWVNAIDRDGDGIPAAFDNCDRVYNPSQADDDGDGVGDACDECPSHPSEWLSDTDEDGILDCRDACPLDPPDPNSPGDTYGDADGDGWCNGADNCRGVFNPNQRSANHHSEGRWNALGLGDACEPVPVPDALSAAADTLGSWGVDHPWHKSQWLHSKNDRLIVHPRPSRKSTDGTAVTPPDPIITHVRFCQRPDPEDLLATPCQSAAGIDDEHLELLLPGAGAQQPEMPYHRVTMSFAPGQRGATTPISYDGTLRSWTWDYQSDAAFWLANDIVNVPGPEGIPTLPGGPASGLDGVIWLHAATTIGHPGGVSLGTGTHDGATEAATTQLMGTEQLANRYVELDPERVSHAQWTRPLQHALPLFLWRVLPDPPSQWRYGADPSLPRGAAELIVPFAGEHGTELGLLSLSGEAQLISDRIGAHLLAELRSNELVWASPAEPHRAFGGSSAPLAVGLDAHGRAIVDTVLDDADGYLYGELDRGVVAPARESTRREGLRAVYSRQLGELYLVGGRDDAGEERGDIAAYHLESDTWRTLAPRDALGTVLAATYSFTDRSLYVLDQPNRFAVRLLRVHALSGETEKLAEWQPLPFEQTSLSTDVDGRVLFLLSSEDEHALFRIGLKEGAWVAEELLQGRGDAVHPVVVDEDGYVVYVRARTLSGTRYASLVGNSIALDRLPEAL